MDLDGGLDATLKAVADIHQHVLYGDAPHVFIDMSSLATLSTTAAILLHAEIDRSLRLLERSRVKREVRGNLPARGSDAFEMLASIGFFRRLPVRMRPGAPLAKVPAVTPERAKWFRLRSGAFYAGTIGRELVEHYERYFDIPFVWKDLFMTALTETLDNVGQHAYIEPIDSRPFIVGRWWILGRAQPSQKEVRFVLWDQGWGVPTTLRQGADTPRGGDSAMLEFAAQRGASRLPGSRGKGFESLTRLVESQGGTIEVWSGSAVLRYRRGSDPVVSTLGAPVPGTLIEWSQTFTPRPAAP